MAYVWHAWHLHLLTVDPNSESIPSPKAEALVDGQNGLDAEPGICNTKGCVRTG